MTPEEEDAIERAERRDDIIGAVLWAIGIALICAWAIVFRWFP
jgi:hypothetical protein